LKRQKIIHLPSGIATRKSSFFYTENTPDNAMASHQDIKKMLQINNLLKSYTNHEPINHILHPGHSGERHNPKESYH
jgi:hypothetical protein